MQQNKTKQTNEEDEDNNWQPVSDQMTDILACEDMARYKIERKKVFIPTNLTGYEREDFLIRVLGRF